MAAQTTVLQRAPNGGCMLAALENASPRSVFDAADVAGFCQTDVATIYTWVKNGSVQFFKTPGGHLRFTREAILDFLRRYGFPIPFEVERGRACVIVVDHDSSWRAELQCALTRSFDVVVYDDPYDALLAIGCGRPDAVVMDVRWHALDSVRCIKRIRAAETLPHTRIMVFSAHESEREACIEAGASAFVLKPATDELCNSLRQALGQR